MNTTEQLIEWLKDLDSQSPYNNPNRCALLRQLIAERPYEPGEEIEIKLREEDEWSSARFACIDPSDTNYIFYYRYRYGAFSSCRCRFHRRPPKTYRVTVPEEEVELAKAIVKEDEVRGGYRGNSVRLARTVANPENWETSDG